LVTARLWGKFFWAKKHLKTTLFAKSKSDQEAPTRGLLRVWRLFLSSLSPTPISLSTTFYIKMPALFNVKEMEAPESLPNNKVMEVSQGCAGAAALRSSTPPPGARPGLPQTGFHYRS